MRTAFTTVSGTAKGYAPDEVEAFFARAREDYEGEGSGLTAEDVHNVAFAFVRGGYRTSQVDAALDRLERAIIERDKQRVIQSRGEQAWLAQTAALADTLRPRLARPSGERFRPGRRGQLSYDRQQVDELCDRLSEFLDSRRRLSPRDIAGAVFKSRHGDSGYDERSVDAFLARTEQVLSALA